MTLAARLLLAGTLATTLVAPAARAEGVRQERAEHPRIAKAIAELEETVRYLEAAPHDFGGHKAEAIAASRKAIEELRLAMAYRAVQDTKRGK